MFRLDVEIAAGNIERCTILNYKRVAVVELVAQHHDFSKGFASDRDHRHAQRFQFSEQRYCWGKAIAAMVEQAAIEIGKDEPHGVVCTNLVQLRTILVICLPLLLCIIYPDHWFAFV